MVDEIDAQNLPPEIQRCKEKITNLELALNAKQKTNKDADQAAKRTERLYKHLAAQAEEEKKNNQRLQDQIARLQRQLKTIKKQVEEAEDIANINLSKFRKASNQLKDAEERAVVAESELSKIKNKN